MRPLDPNLPSLNLRQFCLKIFQHCPLFSGYDTAVHSNAFSEFLAYKTRVPVRGAILLNEAMTEVVLVKGWKKGANWSFPRGKINKDEEDIDCAVREVYEETGYDVRAAGLVNESEARHIEVTMREQHMKLFVFVGIPMETHFEPRTRKEISKIQWYKLSDLPTSKRLKQQHQEAQNANGNASRFYMVAPFINPLKRIIKQLRNASEPSGSLNAPAVWPSKTPATDSHSAMQNEAEKGMSTGGMEDLMAKLRQSNGAAENHCSPSYAKPSLSEGHVASRIKSLLKISENASWSAPTTEVTHDTADVRDGKAQAILSMLQLKESRTFKESTGRREPNQIQYGMGLVLGPVSAAERPFSERAPVTLLPKSTPPIPGHERAVDSFSSSIGPSSHLEGAVHHRDSYIPMDRPEEQQMRQPLVPTAPYHRTGDFSLFQSPSTSLVEKSVNAPAAGKLPPPKLNQHSSALLNLFKGPRADAQAATAGKASVPTGHGMLQLESSTRRNLPASPLPFAALANPEDPCIDEKVRSLGQRPVAAAQGASKQPPSHQQALLQLFQSTSKTKDVPSPGPSRAAAELSAGPWLTNEAPTKTQQNTRHSASSSATPRQQRITVARRPEAIEKAQHTDKARVEANQGSSKTMKILPRPGSRNGMPSEPQISKATPLHKAVEPNASRKGETFQPRILKRPKSKPMTQSTYLDGDLALPYSQSGTLTTKIRRETAREKAIAINHEGTSNPTLTSALNSRGSPSAEFDGHGPSPSALDALESFEKSRSSYESTKSVDQSFLLGFLDEVARGGK